MTDKPLKRISFPKKEAESLIKKVNIATESGATDAPAVLKELQGQFFEMLLTPITRNGQGQGSFEEIYQYVKIRDKVEDAKAKGVLDLTEEQFDLVRNAALSFNGWSYVFPEFILLVREAIEKVEDYHPPKAAD